MSNCAEQTKRKWTYYKDADDVKYAPNRRVLGSRVHMDFSGDLNWVESDMKLIALARELLEFAEEVRRTGDTRLASMATALLSNLS